MHEKSLDELASELVLNHKGPLVEAVPEGPGGHVGAVVDYMKKSQESEEYEVTPDTIEKDAQNIVPVESFEDKVMEGTDSDTSTHDMPIVNNEGLKEPDAEYGKYWTEKSITAAEQESLDEESLEKAGPFFGKRGGKYSDPQHKIPWREGGVSSGAKDDGTGIVGKTSSGKNISRIPKPDSYYKDWTPKDHSEASELFKEQGLRHPFASTMSLMHHAMWNQVSETSEAKKYQIQKDVNRYRKQARNAIKDHNQREQAEHEKEESYKSLDGKGLTEMKDYLEKSRVATPIGGITPGNRKRVSKDKYVKVESKQQQPKKKYDTPYETVKHPPSVEANKEKFRGYYESAKQVSPTQYHPPQDKNAIRSELSKLPKGTFVEYTDESGYQDTSMVKISDTHWSGITGDTETTKQVADGIFGQTHSQKGKVTVNITKQPVKKSLDGLAGMSEYLEKSGRNSGGYNKPIILERIAGMTASERAETDALIGKPMLEGLKALEKALPGHEPKMVAGTSNSIGGSANGGNLEGTGTTSGAVPAAPGPGQDADGQLKGVPASKAEKLSEDDKKDEEQMKTHKKPIETTRKSVFPAGQRDTVAYELAQYRSKLAKAEDANSIVSADEQAANYVKNDGFYRGPSPTLNVNRDVLLKGSQKCPECEKGFSKSLSGCPSCGWNAIGHRVLPQTFLGQDSIKNKPMLRKAHQEPDIVIGGGGPAYVVKTM